MLLVGSRNIQGKVVGRAGIATAATMAVLIAAIRSANAGPPPDPPLALLGFAAIYLAPAALGFIGHRRGDGPTLAAAAILCALASVTSFGGPTLPFLIPAALLAVAAVGRLWRLRSVVGAAVAASLIVATWFAVVEVPAGMALAPVLVGLALVLAVAATMTRTSPPPIIPSDGAAADPREPEQR